jgi:hypothetical protein
VSLYFVRLRFFWNLKKSCAIQDSIPNPKFSKKNRPYFLIVQFFFQNCGENSVRTINKELISKGECKFLVNYF